MSSSEEQAKLIKDASLEAEPIKETVIDLSNLTDLQRLLLILTGIAFVVEIIYLINIGLFTKFFTGFIVVPFNLIGQYITSYMNTLVPYLTILFFFVMIYIAYKILENEKNAIKIFVNVFNYVGLGIVALLFMMFVALFSIPATSTQLYPTMLELILFLIVVLVSVFIIIAPFGIFNMMKTETGKDK